MRVGYYVQSLYTWAPYLGLLSIARLEAVRREIEVKAYRGPFRDITLIGHKGAARDDDAMASIVAESE